MRRKCYCVCFSCPNAPEAPAGGQQIQQGEARVGAVLDHLLCSAEAVGGGNAHQGGERAAGDLLS